MTADPATEAVHIVHFMANEFAGLALADERDLDALGDFIGESRAHEWRPVPMFWASDEGLPVPDLAEEAGGLVLNQRAYEALNDLLAGHGEFLDMQVQGVGAHWLFNVTSMSDALDESASELKYFRSGRIMDVERYSFDADKLVGETVFRLSQLPAGRLYCTDAFKLRVEESELRGLEFVTVWPAR